MAWAEAALEEIGLAQIWVRRGQSADAGTDEGAAAEAPAAAQTGMAEAAPAAAIERPARTARAPVQDEAPPAVARSRDAAPAREPVAPARRVDDGDRAPAPVEPIVPIASTDTMPPMDDIPPADADDFAWFDAAPPGDSVPVLESRPVGTPVAALDWDALAARVADCTQCRLCEKRTNTVFGVGDREADWMLIGEAPGENEDKQGEPFVGQAGKLLDNMLQSLSLQRGDNVYIANVIKCRPPGNRNPEPDEVASCEPYLQRQVALVKPKLIVALGRFAAQTLLKTDASIASLRGRVHAYEGVPVIVTYHPAYLLRSLQDKSKAWADLCLARDTFRRAEGADANGPAGQ
ncbi:TPA: uracil-DNA glycosylase [Burkholderia aenigmatica]|uniref:uracil-DNA glycosylase n=1 Tax=Burkholderia sp. AU45251 TaxID=3059204 RepID=UPI00264C1374|nr:uracil-DNA glycosylase [Burkholderia sp. AU45251]HDR9482705.1 uracil-DNA glycosylase [Burkholderia aenigmatica]MDN7517864.1 uracil-DNA glycosylase [Burkholderia sp. AU45251]HDR9513652.1 uracil-DNA glycosylase [Burkholderia aenigmatica]HDR9591043.1 uracil-DNA glycosylase [Burkholderia aenigmatica]HDR9599025.1 uracil-DNA glycosylase [Burkholderia aenigmatica]